MKRIFIAILICYGMLAEAGGFTVKNGGGLSEFNLEYAVIYSRGLLNSCYTQKVCQLSNGELKLAKLILNSDPFRLFFVSHSEFIKNSAKNIDPIFKWTSSTTVDVNQEAIYPNDEPLSVQQALFLILQFTAKSYANNKLAHSLAIKVSHSSDLQSDQWSLKSYGYIDLGLLLFTSNKDTQFNFYGGGKPYSLKTELMSALNCPVGMRPSRIEALDHFHWLDIKRTSLNEFILPFSGQIYYRCSNATQTISFQAEIQGELGLKLPKATVQDFLNGKSLEVIELQKSQFNLYLIRQTL